MKNSMRRSKMGRCGKCVADIPEKMKKCPHCGSEPKKKSAISQVIGAIVDGFFLVVDFFD